MYYSIDRFENDSAVLQDDNGKNHMVKRSLLPPNAEQGAVFILKDNHYLPAPDETARRRNYILKLQEKLMNGR